MPDSPPSPRTRRRPSGAARFRCGASTSSTPRRSP